MKNAYAYWPVKLKGLEEEAHITCNFFGKQAIHPLEMARIIHGLETKFKWTGSIEPAQFSRYAHVLEFKEPSEENRILHSALTEFKADDYPTWRPHITVPYDYWVKVMISDQPVAALIESIGPLTLKVNGTDVGTF